MRRMLAMIVWLIAAPAWAFPDNTTLLDDFNRTAEDPLSQSGAWTCPFGNGSPNAKTNGTAAVGHASSNWANCYRSTAITAPMNYYAKVSNLPSVGASLEVWGGAHDPGVAGRDGYFVFFTLESATDTWDIYREDNGAQTLIKTGGAQNLGAGDHVGIALVSGSPNKVQAWYVTSAGEGTLLLEVDATCESVACTNHTGSDYTTTPGYVAITIQEPGGTTEIDEVRGGTLGTPSPVTTPGQRLMGSAK